MSNTAEVTAVAVVINVGHNTEFKLEGVSGVWKFGSVAGYTAQCYLESCSNYNQSTRNFDPDMALSLQDAISQAVEKATTRRESLVWASRQAAVISADPVYRDRFQAKLALLPTLNMGALVRLEGTVYRLSPLQGNRDHLRLVPVPA